MSDRINIRPATLADARQIAKLCHQLGYASSEAAVEQRLKHIQQERNHAVFVAESLNGAIAWIHVYVCPHVQVDLQAEIGGLIVDENDRRCGIGQRLMQHAQQWAYEQGCTNILVRSNIIRQKAHNFYQKIGYSKIKTSLVFHKALVLPPL